MNDTGDQTSLFVLGRPSVMIVKTLCQTLWRRLVAARVWSCVALATYVFVLPGGSPGDLRLRWPAIPLLLVVATSATRKGPDRCQ